MKRYENAVRVLNHCGAEVGLDSSIMNLICKEKEIEYDSLSSLMRTTVEDEAKERYLALSFILALDRNRYGALNLISSSPGLSPTPHGAGLVDGV